MAVTKLTAAEFSRDHPSVWFLERNRENLGTLMEHAFNDRYASYSEEAAPKLKQAEQVGAVVTP